MRPSVSTKRSRFPDLRSYISRCNARQSATITARKSSLIAALLSLASLLGVSALEVAGSVQRKTCLQAPNYFEKMSSDTPVPTPTQPPPSAEQPAEAPPTLRTPESNTGAGGRTGGGRGRSGGAGRTGGGGRNYINHQGRSGGGRTPMGGRGLVSTDGAGGRGTPHQHRGTAPVSVHSSSGVPFGHVPAYLPGSSSLVEELDQRILIVLRDGKHLIGVSFAGLSLLLVLARGILNLFFLARPGPFYSFSLI